MHGTINIKIVLNTYLLTPWCRVLLEKLTGLQLVKKFPAFHGNRRFIFTALTSVRHLSLSWANPIQSIHPHPTSWRSILILSTHLRLGLPSGLLPSGFPARPYTPPLLTYIIKYLLNIHLLRFRKEILWIYEERVFCRVKALPRRFYFQNIVRRYGTGVNVI